MSPDKNIHDIVLKNMKHLREKKGWRKSDLARHAEVDASHLSNIENKKKHMGLDLLARIAKALGVQPYEMLRENETQNLSLKDKLDLIEQLPEIKRIAIEQMVNAFIYENRKL